MAKKIRKKITTVREHPLRVPVSEKNPVGITLMRPIMMRSSLHGRIISIKFTGRI